MKHLKIYELFFDKYNIIKKGDFVLVSTTIDMQGRAIEQIYLVLDDVYFEDEAVDVFAIGSFTQNYKGRKEAELIFTKYNNKARLYKNYRLLNITEKNLIYEYMSSTDKNAKVYLEIIKDKTGINLMNSKEYMDYLFKQDVNKYNL